jgi:deoxycytidylate deaminase
MGRQVGASIATKEGEVTAVGCNEVPSKLGGPYWDGDQDDHRDHKEGKDSNHENRKRIVDSIIRELKGRILDEAKLEEIIRVTLEHAQSSDSDPDLAVAIVLSTLRQKQIGTNIEEVRRLVSGSDLKEITEYGRAVHAEMDAILTSARLGISPSGKHLYTTTFPCHNCTRHIIASGIKKVVYIEPYPKSKARDLHSDAICFDEDEAKVTGKIPFVPFVGIGPRRYLDLFSYHLSSGEKVGRKGEDGQPVVWDTQHHKGPRVPMENYSYVDREQKVLDEHKAKLRRLAAAGED